MDEIQGWKGGCYHCCHPYAVDSRRLSFFVATPFAFANHLVSTATSTRSKYGFTASESPHREQQNRDNDIFNLKSPNYFTLDPLL